MLSTYTCAVVCRGSPCLIGGTVCVCVYLVATRAHPNTSGPAAAAELILAQDVRMPQFPLAWPMRDEERTREK